MDWFNPSRETFGVDTGTIRQALKRSKLIDAGSRASNTVAASLL
ncbi:hypothetical protein P8935_22735 [Telmatobacter sp. DSM 110680]|uniref:Uncharacterized protein n=1 Tax=Telmatobacter sp. DSM 110680 TaxID=3036704 RepID=A0AAU7DI31_9BACT